MGLWRNIFTNKSRNRGPESGKGVAMQDSAGIWPSLQNDGKCAAHGRHAVERDSLTRLLGRLLLFHHLHAVVHGRSHRRRRNGPSRTGRIGRCLAKQANKGSYKEKMAKQAHHRFCKLEPRSPIGNWFFSE